MHGASEVFLARAVTSFVARTSKTSSAVLDQTFSMTRLAAIALAVLLALQAEAQTAPQNQPPAKPKPGTILDRPESGQIVSPPTPAPPTPTAPATATGPLAGQTIERFEAVGNTSVASD